MTDLNSLVAYVDGDFIPLRDASVSILDLGFIHSDSTYDVCHVWDGKFFRLDWHLDRFFHSAEGLRIPIPLKRKELEEVLNECVSRNRLKNAFVWMTCLRGIPESGNPRDLNSCKPRLIAYSKPYYAIKVGENATKAVSLVVSKKVRFPVESMDPRHKSFHWGDLTGAQFEAVDADADTAVLVDGNGGITEGPGFNVFMVKNGNVITPKDGVLEGITRKAIIEICKESKIPCELRNPSVEEFQGADEIFLSSTSGGVTPVNRLNGRSLEKSATSERLSKLYWDKHASPDWTTEVRY